MRTPGKFFRMDRIAGVVITASPIQLVDRINSRSMLRFSDNFIGIACYRHWLKRIDPVSGLIAFPGPGLIWRGLPSLVDPEPLVWVAADKIFYDGIVTLSVLFQVFGFISGATQRHLGAHLYQEAVGLPDQKNG